MARLRSNFQTGLLGESLGAADTNITFSGNGPNIAATGSDYIPIVINPAAYGSINPQAPEIVWISNYTASAGTGIIQRAQEGTTAAAWNAGTAWALASTKQDFTLSSGIVNGDFPAPGAAGQLLASNSTTNASWTSVVSGLTITTGSVSSTTINTSIITSGNTFNAGSVPASAVNYGGVATSPLKTWSIGTSVVAISGFTTYLTFVNGYGYSATGFAWTTVSGSSSSSMTSATQIAQAIGQSTKGTEVTSLYISVNGLGVINLAGPSTVYYVRCYNNYSGGGGSAQILGIA